MLSELSPTARTWRSEILDCEHEGDRIIHEIIDRLNHTFVTPIDREDILALASALDDIVDYTEEVADYLGLYKIEAPMDQAIKLAARAASAAASQIAEAIPQLRGFRDISRYTVEINRLENEGDRITREAIAVVVRRRHRPDGRDPLEGSLRAPRGGDRRDRARREHPRRDRHQELLGARLYSIRRSTRAGAPAAIENGGMSCVTTEFAPITQRSPIVTPLVMTTWAPHQTLSPIRVGPLLVNPCHGTGTLRVVEAVAGIGDEAAVGEHAVLTDLDELGRGDHHAEVQERAGADPHPCRLPAP